MVPKLKLSGKQRKSLKLKLKKFQSLGDLQTLKKILAILSLGDGYSMTDVAEILKISIESIRTWLNKFLTGGMHAIFAKKKRSGRPSKLTNSSSQQVTNGILPSYS